VKIDNVTGAWPQAGLNRADVVFDILVEGGLTRLMAIFQSHPAALVGPIRSARPVDARLLRLFRGGYFAYSGASSAEIRPVRRFSHATLVQDTHDPALFFRRSDHPSPDNLFTTTARLLHALRAEAPKKPGPPQIFRYATTRPKGIPTSRVVVPFPAATAGWTWAGRQWVRSQDGRPDTLMDGSRVNAANVVIMSVTVVGTGIYEANGAQDPLPMVTGTGRAWVLSGGRRVAGRWTRRTISDGLRLTDPHGQVISLTPGRTWVELMPDTETPTFHR
jgi:hypothetical protein